MLDVFLAHGDVSQAAGLVRVMCSGEALPAAWCVVSRRSCRGSACTILYGPS